METKTILIVDDEESVLYVLRNSLLKVGPGYRILTALDGKSALKYFEKYQIDLVITDYRLGGMNGLELIEMISNVQPATRMILITGFGTDEVEEAAHRLNVFAYLKKPIDLNTLRHTARLALGEVSPAESEKNNPGTDVHLYLRQLIEQLQREVGASFILFANVEEKDYITVGEDNSLPREQLALFFNTALAMADKANDLLPAEERTDTWIIRRGSQVHISAGRVDNKHILIVFTDPDTTGSDRFRNIETVLSSIQDIRNILAYSFTKPGKSALVDDRFDQAVQSELDKLFMDFSGSDVEGSSTQSTPDNSFSMSYEEALSLGLILPNEERNNPENRQ
jgi:CheY-like chemotaxis protein